MIQNRVRQTLQACLLLLAGAVLFTGHLDRPQKFTPQRDSPHFDFPDEAIAFRNLQLRDENGYIDPSGLIRAKAHMDAMRASSLNSAGAAGVQTTSWTWLGPGNIGGRVRSIVVDPTNQSTWLAGGVAGGIWKTTNSGGTWAPVNDFLANLAVSTMVIQPGTPLTMYAGTGEGFYNGDRVQGAGIFKSIDGGANWSQLASTAGSNYYFVNRVAMSANGSVLLAATASGLFRSVDGGSSFTQVISTGVGLGITDVAFHPTDSTKAIASGFDGDAWYSTNGGLNWTAATGLPAASFRRVEIAYAPSNPVIVFASVDFNNGTIYKSSDGGATYVQLTTAPASYLNGQGGYDNALWVDPTNANSLVIGGLDLWRSTDGGATWTQISDWRYSPSSPHADHHAIVSLPGFNGTTNTTVLFGNDGGIYSTANIYTAGAANNHTSGWVYQNHNLGITQFYGAAGNPASGVIVGGTQDNGTLRYSPASGPQGYTAMFGGDGGFAGADQTNPAYFYGEYVYLQIHRSSDGAISSAYINGAVSSTTCKSAPYVITDSCNNNKANFIAPFVLDPNNQQTLLGGGDQLWRTNDARTANTSTTGPSWASIKASDAGSYISAIAVAQGNSNLCWVGHNNGDVFKSTNCTSATPTWTQVDTNGVGLPNRVVLRITVDGSNNNRVYVTFGGYVANNLWLTTDAGTTWASTSGSGGTALPSAPVRDLAIYPTNPSWLYAATEVGVFTSQDQGVTWSVPQDGPANVAVDQLFWMGSNLVAATHGRGLFVATPSSTIDFAVSVQPSSQLVPVGGAAAYTVNIVPSGGFALPVTLSCSNLPANATCNFATNPSTPGSVAFTVNTTGSTPAGTTQFTVTGVNGALTHNANANITVELSTVLALTHTPNPSTLGQPVTLTASTTPTAATGKVVFYDGVTILGSANLAGGQATLSPRTLSAGAHSLKALYLGDSTYAPASTVPAPHTVASLAQSGFGGAVNYATGGIPYSVAAADFNNDGKIDLAVANLSSNNVSILRGNGNGTFVAATNYNVGVEPGSVAAADFNGDGRVDLVVANYLSNNASVLLGNGDGTFQTAVNYNAGLGPQSVATGDFNGDGKTDFALVNIDGTVNVFLGNGDGTFATPLTYIGGLGPVFITVGDFNGDGKADLAVADYDGSLVNVLIGNGDGTFQAAAGYGVGTNATSVAVGDFNGDGKADLAVSNYTSNDVSVLLGNGDGTFQAPVSYAAGTNPFYVVVGDFNGDGKTDIAVANINPPSNNVAVLLGNGNGTFQAAVNYSVGANPDALAVSDFNGDGVSDLAVTNYSSNNVSILLGQGVPDLTLTKLHTGVFAQGQTGATYTITVSNRGGGATSGLVTMTDTVPTGLTATALSGSGWICTVGTGTCTRSDALASGASYPAITLTVSVAANAAALITNNASISGGNDSNATNNTASDPTTVSQGADLTVTKSHSGSLTQGQAVSYTVTVNNIGAGPSAGTVTLVDAPGAGLTVTALSGAGWTCTLGTLTCTRSDALAASSSYPAISVTANVLPNSPANVSNTATVSGGGELITTNDTATDTASVTLVPDITIVKTHSGNFTQGQTGAVYTITVSNSGGLSSSGTVTVVDSLPASLTATALSGTGWSCTIGNLTCTRSDVLAPAASYPAITLTSNVAANAPANILNIATISGGGETFTSNDTANDATSVTQLADLTVSKSHAGSFIQGQVGASYTITVNNIGPGPTTGTVTVVDTLPAGLTATAISGTGWNCTLGTLTCTRSGVLAASASYPAITLTVNVSATAAALLTNNVAVSGGGEVITNNDSASDPTTVNPVSDLTITLSHAGNFTQGQTGATYTMTVNNIGLGPTAGVVSATDTVPPGLTATAISGSGWTCTLGNLTCTRSDVLPAATSYPAITVTVNVAANAAVSIINNAAVSGGGELVTANDTAADSTAVIQNTTLGLARSPNPALFGQPVTLTATITPSTTPGRVTFYDGTTVLGTSTISGGTAVLTTRLLPAGSHSLLAYFPGAGGGLYFPSSSAMLALSVFSSPQSGFQAAVNYNAGNLPDLVVTGDFNNDGKADLAVPNYNDNNVSVFLGTGSGTFQPAVNYNTGTQPLGVAVGDFNADGKTDLVLANNGSNNVSVLLGNGDGTFQAAVNYAAGNRAYTVAVGDFNGDGKADLAVTNQSDSTVSILLGNGDGTFQAAVNYATGSNPSGVTVADFNANGKADLMVVNNSGTVSILLGNGDGTFQVAVPYKIGTTGVAGVVADFNGDGKLDLAVTNSGSNNVSILLGNGNGTFQNAVNYAVGVTPNFLAVGDLNGDGKLDLAVPNYGDNNVSVLLGNGDGTFQTAVNYAAGTGAGAVAVGDFNGDGTSDLAVANAGTTTISILLGISNANYLVGDGYPSTGDVAALFGDNSLDNFDLIAALRAVTLIPGAVPATCSDRFDAMDSFPVDGASRGGDGALNNFDLIQTLRRVTSLDTTRPHRTARGLPCPDAAPLSVARPSAPNNITTGTRSRRVPIYFTPSSDEVLHGLSFSAGSGAERLRFVPGDLGAPTLLDTALPGKMAAAWLDDLKVTKGRRILLGYIELQVAGEVQIFGGDAGQKSYAPQ